MSKDTFRGLIVGMLIMCLFFTGIPVSADTTDTFSNRLIAAINTLRGSVDTNAMKVGGIATAINNQSSALSTAIGNISAGGSSGMPKVKCVAATTSAYSSGTSTISGSGFVICTSGSIKVTLDGNTVILTGFYSYVGSSGTNNSAAAASGGTTNIGYFNSSASIVRDTSTNGSGHHGSGAIYVYV